MDGSSAFGKSHWQIAKSEAKRQCKEKEPNLETDHHYGLSIENIGYKAVMCAVSQV